MRSVLPASDWQSHWEFPFASKEEGLTTKLFARFSSGIRLAKAVRSYTIISLKLTFGSFSLKQISFVNMPRSYLASKPAPNPQLSGFLTWTKSNFAAILADSNEIAALAGIDREHELVVIYRPLPIKSPAGDFIAIAGNMSNEQCWLL